MLQCELEQGCVLPETKNLTHTQANRPTKADVIFVTDPLCSHCWAIEPMWRRLNCNYQFTTRYIHGGLLPGWQGFADAGNGISGPLDVIPHWQYVADVYQQPINTSIWRDDPISNSYILCKAALVARHLLPKQESNFVRFMRERIFLYAKNLSDERLLMRCAEDFAFDPDVFLSLLHSAQINSLFMHEQNEMYGLGARGFPSIIFLSERPEKVVGSASYAALEAGLLVQNNPNVRKIELSDTQKLLSYRSWTLREATEVLQCTEASARYLLQGLGFKLSRIANADFWKIN